MTVKDKLPRPVELLAPARDADTAITAIMHGADAVYMGASSHGARSAAANTVEEIARVVNVAHSFDARVYVTVNTIIYDGELDDVGRLINQLYRVGVDAIIVQDTAVLEMDLPPIQLHASTQMDIRTPEKARWLGKVGFSRIVVAREMSLAQTAALADATDASIEAFVHGALCVSYSGDCQAGWMTSGRSANRGECPQVCRYKYDLEDAAGHKLITGKHLLSLRDLNLSARVGDLLSAGVSSLKIEGRLKDVAYVKNAVAAYRRVLDAIIDDNPNLYTRASSGQVKLSFKPVLDKGFNRGFTSYFIDGEVDKGTRMASLDTPKMAGERAGVVTDVNGTRLKIRADVELHNGDGIGYVDRSGEFTGVRVNRVDGNRIYISRPVDISRGTVIFRNRDKERDDIMSGETARRTIGLTVTLREISQGRVVMETADKRGCRAVVVKELNPAPSRTPQAASRIKVLSKLGGTIYRLDKLNDGLGDKFIPASQLTSLRRDAVNALESAHNAAFRTLKPATREYVAPEWPLTRHDNIANRLARQFYRKCGVPGVQPAAMEVREGSRRDRDCVVMSTRYCLRRELGRCLKTSDGRQWRGPLFLVSGAGRFRVDFDCGACMMKVVANPVDNR